MYECTCSCTTLRVQQLSVDADKNANLLQKNNKDTIARQGSCLILAVPMTFVICTAWLVGIPLAGQDSGQLI